MEAEYWILSILAVAVALVAGFIGGRMSSASQRQVEAMARERDEARDEAENVRAEVNRHFEESARMFGKLASDYRTFFQQFARTAQNLGLSEGRARELLQQADPNLVSERQGPSASAAGAAAPGAAADEPAPAEAEAGSDAARDPSAERETDEEAPGAAPGERGPAASGAAAAQADDRADAASASPRDADGAGDEGEREDKSRKE